MIWFIGWVVLVATVWCVWYFPGLFAPLFIFLLGVIIASVWLPWLRGFRWGLFLSFVAVGLSSFRFSPTTGDVCEGFVSSTFNGGNVVSVYHCGVAGFLPVGITVYCGGLCKDTLYTVVSIKVVSTKTFGGNVATGVVVGHDLLSRCWFVREVLSILRYGYEFKLAMYESIEGFAGEDVGLVGVGMLFGEIVADSNGKSELFVKLGLAHIFAVSGVNIQYLLSFIEGIIGTKRVRFRDNARAFVAVALGVIVGPTISYLRAILSLFLDFLLSKYGFIPSQYRIFGVLSLLLLSDLSMVARAGYWFVSAACIGVYVVAPQVVFVLESFFRKKAVVREILVSVVVWMCVVPVSVSYFQQFSIPGLVLGMLISPLVEVISVVGYVLLPVSVLIPHIGLPYGVLVAVLLALLELFHAVLLGGG